MKKNIRIMMFNVLLLSVFACSCKRSKTVDSCGYDIARIIYTDTDSPWADIRIGPIYPRDYEDIYSESLRELKLGDSTFLNRVLGRIDDRGVAVVDTSQGIDTWILVLLHRVNNDSVDTLATNWYQNWFNGEEFIDNSVFLLVIDEIIRHDEEWAELVSEYYVDNRWLDYSEIEYKKKYQN